MPECHPVHPQPKDAPCRADRDPLDTDFLTHNYQMIKDAKFEVSLLRNFEK